MEWIDSIKPDDVKPSAPRWTTWDRVIVGVLAFTLVASLVFVFLPLLQQRRSMQIQIKRLEQEAQLEEQKGSRLRQEIQALQSDPAYIERMARDKLNLAAPGETLYQFEQPRNAPASTRTPSVPR